MFRWLTNKRQYNFGKWALCIYIYICVVYMLIEHATMMYCWAKIYIGQIQSTHTHDTIAKKTWEIKKINNTLPTVKRDFGMQQLHQRIKTTATTNITTTIPLNRHITTFRKKKRRRKLLCSEECNDKLCTIRFRFPTMFLWRNVRLSHFQCKNVRFVEIQTFFQLIFESCPTTKKKLNVKEYMIILVSWAFFFDVFFIALSSLCTGN